MRARVDRKLASLIVLASLGAALLVGGCGLEGTDFNDAFSEEALDLAGILGPIDSDFSASEDESVRAAGQTGRKTADQKAADVAYADAKAALKIPDPASQNYDQLLANNVATVNRAIDIAPANADLRLEKAVLEVASNQSPATTKAHTIYVMGKFRVSEENARVRFLDAYIEKLGANVLGFGNALLEIEASRLRTELCAQYVIFKRDFPKEFKAKSEKNTSAYRFAC